jgi:integrase
MAQVIRRKGSPFWYARFEHAGKAYLVSTKKTSRREALKFLETKRQVVTGTRTTEDAARAVLDTLGVDLDPKANALRVLTAKLIALADPDDTVAALSERILAQTAEATGAPAALAALTEKRRRWSRTILGAQGTAVPLDKAWDAWLNAPRRRTAGESTLATAYLPTWTRFVKWAGGRQIRHLHELTPADAADYISFLQSESLSANTIRNHRAFLAGIWTSLKLQAGLTDNPWSALPVPDAVPSIRRALSMEELKKLFAAATDPEDQLAIALGLFAALRLGDVANLAWTSVNLAERMIVVRPHKTAKYGRDVRIPIHATLHAQLAAARAAAPSSPWVCPRLHGLYAEARFLASKRILGIFKTAGIGLHGEKTDRRIKVPSLGAFHALRHSFISFAARAGVPQLAVRAIVGHSNAATTRLYEHVDEPTLQKAVEAIPVIAMEPGRKPSGE